jgi:methylglutaconyl-CoA hydratase
MHYTHLITRRVGPIEYVSLNRPAVRNAFNDELIAELTAWASAAHSDRDVQVVVLAGEGKTFCAGADIAWMARTVEYSEEDNMRDASAASAMFGALNTLPIPLIGRVHGAAVGGGAGLAAVCDIVVAEDRAVFGFTEVKLGILPAVISPFVLAKIGRSAARELFLTGARFSAGRARELGLVHAVVPEADLDVTVDVYVRELLGSGRDAMAAAKALIAAVWDQPYEAAVPMTAAALAARRVSAEGQEGLRAFLEKRRPGWSRS